MDKNKNSHLSDYISEKMAVFHSNLPGTDYTVSCNSYLISFILFHSCILSLLQPFMFFQGC
ncbi:hypothetical protein HMPREF0083_04389 [Aneurinibacillus aneurinilyticus ATCC 12856]|uniref:Uncharacterized protein n=1 Tax=Aneurinibacillus aneurinilyticus ATCC 12856 TaxID=649747 RepID=U1Y5T9_ANEAE|nr:hypothetical protein HMPREF0083_04389 [Aneurinibacillus aneurinilyticus ATCC 12856]